MTTSLYLRLSISILLILPVLISPPAAQTNTRLHPPEEDHSWPLFVFARLDSFSVRYNHFFRSHFDTVSIEQLPTWLELDVDSLSFGEHILTRMVVVKDNDQEILRKLRELVSMNDEIGMTQFVPSPDFPSENFVLGHREGSLTLVPYDAMGVKNPLQDLDIVHYLKKRRAFMTDQENREDFVVFCRGNMKEVDIWYPRMAKEVLHTHTIPGNINPTGYLEFFEGSDRDMIMSSYRYQGPIKRYVLSRRETKPSTN